MMTFCIACGMPMVKPEDFGCGDTNAKTCVHCTNADGSVKSAEEIFEGGVQFFMQSVEPDRITAEKITRYNMNHNCPYRKGNTAAVLQGEEVTEEEFTKMMEKLMG